LNKYLANIVVVVVPSFWLYDRPHITTISIRSSWCRF